MDKVFKSFLNFEANEPHEVIPLDRILNRYLFEPPFLQLDEERNLGFTLDQLRKHARGELEIEVPKISCHDVDIERTLVYMIPLHESEESKVLMLKHMIKNSF